MFWRLVTFLLFQCVPALVAWNIFGEPSRGFAALLAAMVGCYLWLLVDVLRGWRLLRWLRAGDTSEVPLAGGMWGEVFDRIRKLVRGRDRAVLESENRLQDFLAGLQASGRKKLPPTGSADREDRGNPIGNAAPPS